MSVHLQNGNLYTDSLFSLHIDLSLFPQIYSERTLCYCPISPGSNKTTCFRAGRAMPSINIFKLHAIRVLKL